MTDKFDGLDEAFNVAGELMPAEKKEIEPVKPKSSSPQDIRKDYEYTRGNLYSIIATDKLMELQKKLKDVEEDSVQKGPTNVTNALFVGSTAELQKMIKKADQNINS